MKQYRDLVPMSVYIPPSAKQEAEERAAVLSIAPATLLRMILLGQQKPLTNSGQPG